MINLLPPDSKKQLAAGRANRLLLRYLILIVAFSLVVIGAIGVAYWYMDGMKRSYQAQIDDNLAASRHMADSQKQVKEFRSNLATAKQILDKRINYSSIVLKVANAIPSGVVIDQLSLDPDMIGTPVKLNAQVASEVAAERLKKSLNDSPYFTDAHYDVLARTSDPDYPFSLVFTVTFTKELLKND